MFDGPSPRRLPWRFFLGLAVVLSSLAFALLSHNRADRAEATGVALRNTAEGLRRKPAEREYAEAETVPKRIEELEEEVRRLRKELEIARIARERLEGREKQLEAAEALVARYRARYGPIDPQPAPVRARILAADNKMNIFLISAGSDDGIREGMELTVYRGDSFVALVVVDKVFRDKASVTVKMEGGTAMKKSDIQQGDRVATVF